MRLLPKQSAHIPHESSEYGTRIPADLLPGDEPVVGECAEGEIVMMNQFVPHHSTLNRSTECRWSMDLRYQATGTPSARPWLPEFVVQSKADPGSEFRDYEAWCDMWDHPNPMPAGTG